MILTESNKMFEALKSLYITGFSASCRKARPFAAPRAIFILVDQGNETEYPGIPEILVQFSNSRQKKQKNVISIMNTK